MRASAQVLEITRLPSPTCRVPDTLSDTPDYPRPMLFLLACAAEEVDSAAPVDTAPADTAHDTAPADTDPPDTDPPDSDDTAPDSGDTAVSWPDVDLTLSDVGFSRCESAAYDPVNDRIVVGNIAGGNSDRDDNGFLSLVSPDGELLELAWVAGEGDDSVMLHGPKGVHWHEGLLYVADVSAVRVFDATTGESVQSWDIQDDGLNDVVVGPDGMVYVTSPNEQRVYQIDPNSGNSAVHAQDEALGGPNGIEADDDGLWVAGFSSGVITRLGIDGQLGETLTPPSGRLDGLVTVENGRLLASSWEAEAVYLVDGKGSSEVAAELPSPADIGFDTTRSRLLVPQLGQDALRILTVAVD